MRSTIVLLLCLCFPGAAFAWGQEGHSIVAEIAQRRLSPEAAAMVEKLLGRGHSLASVASWADEFRANGGEEGNKTAKWHFVDIPLKETNYDKDRDCAPDPANGDCVVAELNRLIKTELRCAKDEDQVRALKYAVHFVGDIHQPLHTVQDLRGANKLEFGIYMSGLTCKPDKCSPLAATDLHTLWDSTLIQRDYWNWGHYVDVLEEGWLKSQDAQGVDGGKPEDWAVETHAKAKEVWDMSPAGTLLDDTYLKKAIEIINRRLGVAGLRLAKVLNDAYADKCAAP